MIPVNTPANSKELCNLSTYKLLLVTVPGLEKNAQNFYTQ